MQLLKILKTLISLRIKPKKIQQKLVEKPNIRRILLKK